MDNKYTYLLAILATDERLVSVEADSYHPIMVGDLVEYDNGKIGEVVEKRIVEKDGEEYKFFTLFHALFNVTGHWSMNWRMETENDNA